MSEAWKIREAWDLDLPALKEYIEAHEPSRPLHTACTALLTRHAESRAHLVSLLPLAEVSAVGEG